MKVAHCPNCFNRMEPYQLRRGNLNKRLHQNVQPGIIKKEKKLFKCTACSQLWSVNGELLSRVETIQAN